MLAPAPHAHYSLEEYLRLEEFANVKHEFLDGQIYAMAGGTPEHGAIAVRLGAALVSQLAGGPCTVYSSDVRVRVTATGLSTYPDLSVGCGEREVDPADVHALIDPIVVAEVLSPSTEAYDRGEKLRHYQQIPALREVVLVAHDRRELEVWRRGGDVRSRETAGAGGTVTLTSIECRLDIDAVYG